MGTLKLPVSDETEEMIRKLSADEKEELAQLITLWANKPRPILQVMEEIGEYASEQGLTEKKLQNLLKK